VTASDPFAGGLEKIRVAEATEPGIIKPVEQSEPVLRARSRALISKLVVCGYLAALAVIGLYLCYRAYYFGDRVFDELIEVLKVGVIPIVTFVIGHYFGSAEK
jgi:hypothetical protein